MKKRFGTLILILLGSLLLLSIVVVSSFIPSRIEELSYNIEKLKYNIWELSDDIEDLIDMSSELFVPYEIEEPLDGIRSSIGIVHVLSPFKLIKDGYMGVVYYDGDIKRSVTYQGQKISY
ncbi:hypothetical protein MYX07_06930, partial [Patescibacteria group bacterium AH-259-L07]|nr:hypothetical protein [Patescibacteria group bacterium AH-259-L07]